MTKVLYFTLVSLSSPKSGGTLCCTNHIEQLCREPGIELTVVSIGKPAERPAHARILENLKLNHRFIETIEPEKIPSRAYLTLPPEHLRIPFETLRIEQAHIGKEIADIARNSDADVIVVDYLYSFHLCFDTLKQIGLPIVYICLNRETELLWQAQTLGAKPSEFLWVLMRTLRCMRFENEVEKCVDRIVCLADNDVPTQEQARKKTRVITPFLNPKSTAWSYKDTRTLLFVGAIDHLPNRLAIEWLCEHLSPALERISPELKIAVVSRGQVNPLLKRRNIEIREINSDLELERLFLECDLFLAPIKNRFGVKFKLLECLAYGTPFLATESCMAGLPFLDKTDVLDLKKPEKSAQLIKALVDSPASLSQRSSDMRARLSAFAESANGRWSQVLDLRSSKTH